MMIYSKTKRYLYLKKNEKKAQGIIFMSKDEAMHASRFYENEEKTRGSHGDLARYKLWIIDVLLKLCR